MRGWAKLVFPVAFLAASAGCAPGRSDVLRIGSKAFTEGAILGYVELLALENAGHRVSDRIEMGPTLIVRQALLAGEIDSYVEYTGTALVNFFHIDEPDLLAEPERGYLAIRRLDAPHHLVWLRPWALNNTYTVLMTRQKAKALGIHSISELAKRSPPPVFGSDPEFAARTDGLPGLETHYGLSINVRQMDAGLIYPALRRGSLDAAIGYSTDGRIPGLDLVRLVDDRHYFPAYHPAPVFRQEALLSHPDIVRLLEPLAARMTDDEITRLNLEADLHHVRAKDLARDWLRHQGLWRQ